MASRTARPSSEVVPWYRNVKLIAVFAQIIFVVIVLIVLAILVFNVSRGVKTLGVRTGFGFLADRAGFPLSESLIPYDQNASYARAMLVGVLNTLKVALLGVVLATLLGIMVALMRLSNNWILKQIATVYIETVRNIPLVIQIFFWFSVLLVPSLPSGVNALRFGPIYFNNSSGLIFPWPFASSNFRHWTIWLILALVLAIGVYWWRRRTLLRLERPGNPFWPAAAAFLLVAAVGYFIALAQSRFPENLLVSLDADRGRVNSVLDVNANGTVDNQDTPYATVPVIVTFESASFEVNPQRRTEQRKEINSAFAFPSLRKSEFEEARVEFVNPDLNDRLSVHYTGFPTTGIVYEDRNENERFDAGEDLDESTGEGFEGNDYKLVLFIEGFKRRVLTERDGETRVPRFDSYENASFERLGPSPLAWSFPNFPTDKTLVTGGATLSVSYLALLLALTFYTASFIAEIVRGAILSVPKGQTEASKALGLSNNQTFNLVVFPQAFRIIIPPLISQFLNLTKNSSLGIFCSYQEFFAVSSIVNNQSGASMPIFFILIGGYLIISLTFSFLLNLYNARTQLVER
ncbi:MAG: ABC transporter permease subunit [Trueperaceae bacterium]|nr:ABC transporter permease subunit [Trueperaceae bacterium]